MKSKQLITDNIYVLSDKAVKWIEHVSKCIISWDFWGYIVPLRRKISMMVTIDGQIILFSHNERRPVLSHRQYLREIKRLIKLGILVPDYTFVFEEYANYKTMRNRVDKNNVVYIPDYFFI